MHTDNGNKYFVQKNTALAEQIIKSHAINAENAKAITDLINKQFTTPEDLATESVEELLEQYKDLIDKPIEFSGLSVGLPTLDAELLGIKRKDLVIIGASTGVGKSTLAAYFMANFAQLGHKCLYMAFEDSTRELMSRIGKMLISNGFNEAAKNMRLSHEVKVYGYMTDKYSILPAIEALHRVEGHEIFFLDMLNNLVDTNNDRDASEFINALRSLATKLGIVIVTTVRLRKPQDKDEMQKPSKYSFSGKSDITYSATKIITLVTSDYVNEQDVLFIDSLKNRIRDRNKPKERVKIRIDNEFKVTDLGGVSYGGIEL